MDFTISSIDSLFILTLIIGGFLLIHGLLFLSKYQNSELFSFGICNLSMGLVLLTSNTNYIYFNQFASLIIWPSFYLFLVLLRKSNPLSKNHLAHLTFPFVWLVLSLLVSDNFRSGIFNTIYLIQWLIYVWVCITEIYKSNQSPKVKSVFLPYFFKVLFAGLLLLIILRFSIPIIFQNYDFHKSIIDIVTALYFVIISAYFIHKPLNFPSELIEAELREEEINYEEALKRKLINTMTKDKVFLNPELTLNELADRLEVKVTELSNFINSTLHKNFNDFINEYRVKEFKRLIEAPVTDSKATVIELAFESGFNSKASFNRIFKEATGITPSEYRKSIQTKKTV